MTEQIKNRIKTATKRYQTATTLVTKEAARARAEGLLIAYYDCKAITYEEYIDGIYNMDIN